MPQKITDELEMLIRDEFVHGYVDTDGQRKYPTIDHLVKRHDVARNPLYARSKEGNWQSQKNLYQTELQARIDKERLEKMVEDSKRLDESCIQIAQAMLVTVGRKIQKSIEQERQDPNYAGIDVSALNQLSVVTVNAQRIGKLAMGQAQEISKVAADVSNPEAFHAIMDQLDELAATRAQKYSDSVH